MAFDNCDLEEVMKDYDDQSVIMTPDGDFAGSLMAEVIDDGTGHLTEDDRRAIAAYLLSREPIDRPGGGE